VSRRSKAWLLALVPLALAASPAPAPALEIPPGGAKLEVLDAAGQPDSRAGAHPDRLVSSIQLAPGGSEEEAKEIVIDLSPGFGGGLADFPSCPRQAFSAASGSEQPCPTDSQVGVLRAKFSQEGAPHEEAIPVFNVEPGPNEAAVFGGILVVPVAFVASVRPDQGLSLRVSDIASFPVQLEAIVAEFWGVPADHQEAPTAPREPLLTTPTRCDGSAVGATVTLRTWQQPQRSTSVAVDSGHPLGGCAEIPFDASASIALDNPVADAPTGARVDLVVPQNADPDGRAASQIQEARISLPEGMTVSPAGAAGLGVCSDAQLGLGTEADARCPASSRVGSVELASPGLARPLQGAIYLGEGHPGDRFRIFLVAAGPGSTLKLVQSLRPDPRTGRLTTELRQMPQVSFERMTLRFDGGPRALLATPLSCGPAVSNVRLTPYSGGPAIERSATVAIGRRGGAPCTGLPPFAPSFSGGASDVRAKHQTSFTTTVHREDGEQLPERLLVTFPAGVSATLAAVTPCPAALAQAAACPASSRIGEALSELGPGTEPARLQGDVYLTGPYRGAPFGVALAFGGRLGPFDLGTLVVRGALRMDASSGRVAIATDPLPRVVEGIAVRFQTIQLRIDRPDFIRNPTSCRPATVAATITAAGGAVSRSSVPFSTRGCVLLPFRPAFAMALSGGSRQRREGKPGLRISMRMPAADANLRGAEFALPGAIGFDASALREICSRQAALAGNCPAGSRVGYGEARTPLVAGRLKGALYVVQPHGTRNPDLWASLSAGGLEVTMRMETGQSHGRLVTRMQGLPDVPLESFAVGIAGGRRGVLSLKRGFCAGDAAAAPSSPLRLEGQNGALRHARVALDTGVWCGGE